MLDVALLVCLLYFLMGEQYWHDKNHEILYALIWFSTMQVWRNQLKICVNLVIVAKFVRAFKSLETCIDCVKNDLVFLDKVLDNKSKCALADR